MKFIAAKLSRVVIFAFGDLRSEPCFPWFSFGGRKHLVTPDEALQALSLARYGDIGLHRDRGYFSNVTIPGAMKHAWIHTNDVYATQSEQGKTGGTITEATSDGVLSKNALVPYLTDYAILLRPQGLTDQQRRGACLRAQQIQGADYDVNFRFDMESQAQFYENPDNLAAAQNEGVCQAAMMRRWDRSFSCSEAVAYCFWHVRETLDIYRRRVLGRDAILPQDYLDFNFDIVWASTSLTDQIAAYMGFSEKALLKLYGYRKGIYQ